MHPIERLRMVAQSEGEDPGLIAQEAAASLLALVDQPGGTSPPALLMACRRLIDRHPTCGPLWWLAARLLAAPDPGDEAISAAYDLQHDPTPAALVACLPEDAVVTVLGWPQQIGQALKRRLDLSVLVVDAADEGSAFAALLGRAEGRPTLVSEGSLGAACARSDVVLLEATAVGPGGMCAIAGSWAAAAVGGDAGRAVWAVAGRGRALPQAFWESLVGRVSDLEPWGRRDEIVPLHLVDQVVGPEGPEAVAGALARADCPPVPELTRRGLTPGSDRLHP